MLELVGKILPFPNGFASSLGIIDTKNTQKFQYLELYKRMEKDLITLEDFANYAWAVAKLKIGK